MASLLVSSALGLLLATRPVLGANCRCLPSELCWPSTADWTSLNETVGGRLMKTVPPGSVCYLSQPNYDDALCSKVLINWTAPDFHSSNPYSLSSAWTNSTCDPIYPNGTSIYGDASAGQNGCALGGLPEYSINVTAVEHIQAALDFANKHNIRLSIKNTGHSGSGRNLGTGSLSLWTHNLKAMEYHETFQPRGCSANSSWKGSQKAITLGAGIQGRELYPFMEKHDIVAVTGTSTDVGVAGWSMGGGHGFLTGAYGMGADSILEAHIVTPAGELVIANSCSNSELLWAIRGGGGGTFGIVVNMTVKAYPSPKMSVLAIDFSATNGTSAHSFYKVVAQFHSLLPDLQDQGMGGYYTMQGPPESSALKLSGTLFLFDQPNSTVQQLMAPVKSLLAEASDTVDYSLNTLPITSIFELVKLYPSGGDASRGISASRLIPVRVAKEEPDAFAQTLEDVGPQAVIPSDGTPNPSMSGTLTISRVREDNALNPAWRSTVVHLITNQHWDDSLPASNASRIVDDMIYGKLDSLRRLAPESGAYLNEANPFEPGWQFSYYGANYNRLHHLKQKYDPNGLLWCNRCVGSENWVQSLEGRLCLVYAPF